MDGKEYYAFDGSDMIHLFDFNSYGSGYRKKSWKIFYR